MFTIYSRQYSKFFVLSELFRWTNIMINNNGDDKQRRDQVTNRLRLLNQSDQLNSIFDIEQSRNLCSNKDNLVTLVSQLTIKQNLEENIKYDKRDIIHSTSNLFCSEPSISKGFTPIERKSGKVKSVINQQWLANRTSEN